MEKDINYIISKILAKEASVEEILVFSQWLAEKEENRVEFATLKSYWDAEVTSTNRISSDLSFDRMQRQMSAGQRKRKIIRYSLSIASSIVLFICLGLLSQLYIQGRKAGRLPDKEFTVTADKGQRASVTLPDGSVVWLNSNTTLTYSNEYGKDERLVNLNGEAYFDVSRMKDCRFIVRTGTVDVTALGTTFNVRAYEEDTEVTTTLFEGSVQVSIAGRIALLEPNQTATFNKETRKLIASAPEHPEYAVMWKDNHLAFTGQTLGEIATTLHRLYNIHFEFSSESIRDYRFRGVILNKSLDNVIELISLTAPITYTTVEDTIYIQERYLPPKPPMPMK